MRYYNTLLDIMVPKEGIVSNKKSSKYRHLQDKNSIHGFLTALNWVPKKLPTGPLEVATQGPQSHTNNTSHTDESTLRVYEVA